MPKRVLTFEQWKQMIDLLLEKRIGLSSEALPDWSYYDAYHSGMSASEAVKHVISNARNY
jgi:ethanolamine ammonia-lyase small subunit